MAKIRVYTAEQIENQKKKDRRRRADWMAVAGLVSKADFSRMAGVTRAAISIALSKGRVVAEPDGAMNPKRKENAAYLTTAKRQRRQASGKNGATRAQKPSRVKRGRRKPRDPDDEDSEVGAPAEPLTIDGESYGEAELRKMIADADLKEQKLAQDRGELLTRDDIKLVFARLYQVHASQLKTLAEKLGPDVAGAFKLTDADTLRVQEIMSEEVIRALGQIKKEMNDYLDSIGDGTVDDQN